MPKFAVTALVPKITYYRVYLEVETGNQDDAVDIAENMIYSDIEDHLTGYPETSGWDFEDIQDLTVEEVDE